MRQNWFTQFLRLDSFQCNSLATVTLKLLVSVSMYSDSWGIWWVSMHLEAFPWIRHLSYLLVVCIVTLRFDIKDFYNHNWIVGGAEFRAPIWHPVNAYRMYLKSDLQICFLQITRENFRLEYFSTSPTGPSSSWFLCSTAQYSSSGTSMPLICKVITQWSTRNLNMNMMSGT